MPERPLSDQDRRTVRKLRWRRLGVSVWLLFVWVTLQWLLLVFPVERAVGPRLHTAYGLLRWLEVTSPGAVTVRRPAATITFLLCAGITLFLAAFARRALGNLTPRWQCSNCGFFVRGGFPRNNLCPECGELPNLRKEPWAFWR